MGSTSTITINTNLSSLTCQKYLRDATKGMNSAMEKLSTGFKINSAKDDAAGYAVYTGMEAKINGYDIIETNAKMGLDMLTTQEGILDIINGYLQRIRDLTMQAANGTYGSSSLDAIRTEVEQRMDEINRLCDITDFNDSYLLDGSRTDDINLQVGLYSNKRCVITLDSFLFASAKSTIIMGFFSNENKIDNREGYLDLTCTLTGVTDGEKDIDPDTGKPVDGALEFYARYIDKNGDLTDADGNLLPPGSKPVYRDGTYKSALAAALAENGIIEPAEGKATIVEDKTEDGMTLSIKDMCDAIYRNDSSARAFIDNLDLAIENISLRCTKIGAYMNRLDSAIEATDVQRENLTGAVSTIKDADAATESSNYIKYQILQQATASLLATANQQPQIALNLL